MSALATLGLALCVIGISVTSGANAQATTVGTAFAAIPIATMQGRSPRLTVERGGAVRSWLERTEDGHALHAARIHGGQLESLVKVTDGTNWFINPVDRPSVVALSKTNLAAHWLQRTSSAPHGYVMRMAFSHDNRNTGARVPPALSLYPSEQISLSKTLP
jgi:hypothetical protein